MEHVREEDPEAESLRKLTADKLPTSLGILSHSRWPPVEPLSSSEVHLVHASR